MVWFLFHQTNRLRIGDLIYSSKVKWQNWTLNPAFQLWSRCSAHGPQCLGGTGNLGGDKGKSQGERDVSGRVADISVWLSQAYERLEWIVETEGKGWAEGEGYAIVVASFDLETSSSSFSGIWLKDVCAWCRST